MTPDQIKAAQHKLGLSDTEMGRMLDINDASTFRQYKAHEGASRHRKPAARMVRLFEAYLAGYRPKDWPLDL